MAEAPKCPQCGASLPSEGWAGLCPKCLMHVSLEKPACDTNVSTSISCLPSSRCESLRPEFQRLQRREFFARLADAYLGSALTLAWGAGCLSRPSGPVAARPPRFKTRGIVLIPKDLSLRDWPERATRAGLNTIALHHQNSPRAVIHFLQSAAGQGFLEDCHRLGLQVEYELHAMRELLPRALFAKDPGCFRMNDKSERTADANCCVHSQGALQIIAENALTIARALRPTTGRYFFYGDDGEPWCRCPQCRPYSDSDQALILENYLLRALRQLDARAQFAHLAYANTLRPPEQVRPDPGLFLEYAPIQRRYDIPYSQQSGPNDADGPGLLDANLAIFPRASAQALEYWLDVSRFSGWKRPAVRLPWNREVFLADLETYASRGLQHITTFAAWVDGEYASRFNDLRFIDEYGAGFAHYGKRERP